MLGRTSHVYHVLVKFRSADTLETWRQSRERLALLEERRPLLAREPEYSFQRDGVVSIAESDSPAAQMVTGGGPPPRWKITFLVWCGVVSSVLVTNAIGLSGWLEESVGLTPSLALLASLALVVAFIEYLYMPVVLSKCGRCIRAVPTWRTDCEPMRSLNEGLCCFAPDPDILALRAALTEERRAADRMRLAADRRLTRLEAAAVMSASEELEGAGARDPMLVAQVNSETLRVAKEAVAKAESGAVSPRERRDSVPDYEEGEPITITMRTDVKQGREQDFVDAINNIATFAHKHSEGHLGTTIVRPPAGSGESTYTVQFRYNNYNNLRKWLKSEDRKRLLVPVIEATERQEAAAEVGHLRPFAVLMAPSGPPEREPPPLAPKWKNLLLTTAVLYLAVNFTDAFILPQFGALDTVPSIVVGTAINVAALGFIGLPLAGGWLRRWLVPAQPANNACMRCLNQGCV